MSQTPHKFHIPVMGTGHSVDTCIRVGPYGINSVISLVDDLLFEPIRKHYCKVYDLPYTSIPRSAEDGRARRVEAYCNMAHDVVNIKFNRIKELPFFKDNDKKKYFDILPEEHPLKKDYLEFLQMEAGSDRDKKAQELTDRMVTGSIDVNIMVKLDAAQFDKSGAPMSPEFSDGKAALRGYAKSKLKSSIVLSAGINQALMTYMTEFKDFYRDENGDIKKTIILKVSDYRSTVTQGKFLSRKGLEVFEFRIESGLNCGGHLFPANGLLLPILLDEFTQNREMLSGAFISSIEKYYQKNGLTFPEKARHQKPLITVQGGIGIFGEDQRMKQEYGMDLTGWASPFLQVPEATPVDNVTLDLLKNGREADFYMSDASPLGFPFNNLRNSLSERWTVERIMGGKPGSPCPKKFLVSNTEFTEQAICHASNEYQAMKIDQIKSQNLDKEKETRLINKVTEKTCICDHLGYGSLVALGIMKENSQPASICPGPNLAWFDRVYSLKEMIDHIYGRIPSLVPAERPHMFAKEITLYVDHFQTIIDNCDFSKRSIDTIKEYKENMEAGIDKCREIAGTKPYPGENLASIPECIDRELPRMQQMFERFIEEVNLAVA